MIEAAVLADDDDDMLDGRAGVAAAILGSMGQRRAERQLDERERTEPGASAPGQDRRPVQMAAGLANHVWNLEETVRLLDQGTAGVAS